MIKINLLPVREARKKENVRRQVSLFFLSIVFAVAVMVYLTITMNRNISELTKKIEVARTDLAKYQAQEKEVKKIRAELQKLKDKMNVIARLEANRSGPVRIMDALTHLVIPDKMWLTSLGEGKGEMKLEGVATDNKTVADFMTRMERSPLFEAVNLISSKQVAHGEQKFKEFSITCQLAKPEPEKNSKAS